MHWRLAKGAPGTAGLYKVSWRPLENENEPTSLRPVDLAADLAGNAYVVLQNDACIDDLGVYAITPAGGASFVMLEVTGYHAVRRLILPH